MLGPYPYGADPAGSGLRTDDLDILLDDGKAIFSPVVTTGEVAVCRGVVGDFDGHGRLNSYTQYLGRSEKVTRGLRTSTYVSPARTASL